MSPVLLIFDLYADKKSTWGLLRLEYEMTAKDLYR